MSSYCYVGRYNNDRIYINENTEDILASIDDWVSDKPWPKKPNQTDPRYYTIDIGCSTDVPLMGKLYNWQRVFDFFNEHAMVKSTFATKYPSRFGDYDLNKDKHRIRVSLMPQVYSNILEPNTEPIRLRLDAIAKLSERMEVHVNLSPIIYEADWLAEYRVLLQDLASLKIDTKFECIFLTYNDIQHERNSEAVNKLCWRPELQEHKNSHYADNNIRYKWQFKSTLEKDFLDVFKDYFNLQDIRYIF